MTTGSKNIILLSATLTATLSVGTLLKRAGNNCKNIVFSEFRQGG